MADEDKQVPSEESGTPLKVSRRDFLVGAGAGVVATGAVAAGYIALRKPETVEVIKEVPVTVTQEVPVPAPGEVISPALPGNLQAITLNINGQDYPLMVEPRWTINYLLREKLGLTGTKTGCSRQMCGMCTVLANGRPIYSCTTLAVDYVGQEILTIEGLAQNGQLHPVQQAFIDHNAFQCAWCTPGFIMSTVALLNKNPNPSLDVIKHELSGNLCRCGTYREVFQAVQAAAKNTA